MRCKTLLVYLALAGVACTGGQSEGPIVDVTTDTVHTVRYWPPGWRVESLHDALDQTASVIEGSVASMDYEMHESIPYTVYHLAGVIARLGQPQPQTLDLRQLGGQYPDGSTLSLSHGTEKLQVGKRYLVFLKGVRWTLSPVLSGHAYDVTGDQPRHPETGQPVGGVTEDGVQWATSTGIDKEAFVQQLRAFATANGHTFSRGFFLAQPMPRVIQ